MKFKLASVVFCAAFSGFAMADGCNEADKTCNPSSPFDVTNINFVSDATSHTKPPAEFNNPFDCRTAKFCFGSEVAMSGNALSLIQGMERYAEEYSDWADAMEWLQDYQYVEGINADRTNNLAYAIIARHSRVRIQLEGEVTTRTYREGDIISGSDWNNNGKIDSIEIISEFNYNNSVVSVD